MASSAADENHNLYANTDWELYEHYRPPYPRSLIELIIAFHRVHSNTFQIYHDVGAGGGVLAKHIAPYFAHTHISDPDPANIDKARAALAHLPPKSEGPRTTFTFSVSQGEHAHQCALPGSVSLISVAAAAHWMEIDTFIQSVGKSLSPGGTLAVVSYAVLPKVVELPQIELLWESVMFDLSRLCSHDPTVIAGFAKLDLGNDFIPLPEKLFDPASTRRISLNAHGQGNTPFRLLHDASLEAHPRARPEERRDEYNYPEGGAEGWRYQVGPDWFRGFVLSVPPTHPFLPTVEERLAEIARMVREQPNQEVTLEFPAALLLATRR